jgi:hypothetical protein
LLPQITAKEFIAPLTSQQDFNSRSAARLRDGKQRRVAFGTRGTVGVPDRMRPEFQITFLIDDDAVNWDSQVLTDTLCLRSLSAWP